MKGYWVALYKKINNPDNLKKYAEKVTPIIKSYGGVPLVRGGKYNFYSGEEFSRTVIWEFPSFEKAVECHDCQRLSGGLGFSKKYYGKTLSNSRGI